MRVQESYTLVVEPFRNQEGRCVSLSRETTRTMFRTIRSFAVRRFLPSVHKHNTRKLLDVMFNNFPIEKR